MQKQLEVKVNEKFVILFSCCKINVKSSLHIKRKTLVSVKCCENPEYK